MRVKFKNHFKLLPAHKFMCGIAFYIVLLSGLPSVWGRYWSEYEVKVVLLGKEKGAKLSFEINPQVRFKSGVKEVYYFKTDAGPVFEISEFLNFGFYHVGVEEKEEENWEPSGLVSGYGTFSHEFSDIRLSNRNRFDYKFGYGKYRNLLEIQKLFVFGEEWETRYRLAPFIKNELFYDFITREVDENRLLVGISFGVFKIDFKIAGMLHSQKGSGWNNFGVVVSTLKFVYLKEEY